MKQLLARIWTVYRELVAYALLLGLLGGGTAVWLRPSLAESAVAALAPRRVQATVESPADFEKRVQEYELMREKREAELRRLELVARAALARAEAERAAMEAARREAAVGSSKPAEAAREFESNVDLLSRIEPSRAMALMSGWDDATVAKYVRAMRAPRAADLVAAMSADPAWKDRLAKILRP